MLTYLEPKSFGGQNFTRYLKGIENRRCLVGFSIQFYGGIETAAFRVKPYLSWLCYTSKEEINMA